jgi:hypothetical protein
MKSTLFTNVERGRNSDVTNEIQKLKEMIKKSTTLSGVIKDALGSMGTLVCALIELSSIQLCIERNELRDKKQIALYGSKAETGIAEIRPLKLDPKCIS